MANSRPLVVDSLDPHSVSLLLKSPPAKKQGPRVWKKASKCSAFKLCRGGQYTAVIVISRSGPLLMWLEFPVLHIAIVRSMQLYSLGVSRCHRGPFRLGGWYSKVHTRGW